MKRVQVTDEELAILEGLRHERAIWNKALETALVRCVELKGDFRDDEAYGALQAMENVLMELRK